MDLLINIFLGYRNGQRAKKKGYNNIAWTLYSIGAFILTELVGWMVMFALFYNGGTSQEELVAFMLGNPVRAFTAFFCGVGGYLLIRYRVNQLPIKATKD